MSEYNQVKKELVDMLEELENRLEHITQDVQRAEKPLDPDFAEQAVETENDPVLDALGESTVSEIEQIRLALSRIEEGDYGLCQQCGEPIKKERLKALPYATLCIQCAEKASSHR